MILNSVQEFIELEARLLLSFFICLHDSVQYILLSRNKECRCLKKVIHQVDRK